MQNEIMGRVAFAAQYAKPTPNGRESWEDAVDRVATMHKKKYPNLIDQIDEAMAVLNRTASTDAVRAVLSHNHK